MYYCTLLLLFFKCVVAQDPFYTSSNQNLLATLLSNQNNFQSGLVSILMQRLGVQFIPNPTKCPLRVPFCHRSKCGQEYPDSETNPNSCHRNVSCCFDDDLLKYRHIYGASYMSNVPACYHGATAKGFRSLARAVYPTIQVWTPMYRQRIVELFVRSRNLSLNIDVLGRHCSLTSIIKLRGLVCGWRDITETECRLKDCCFDAETQTCRYSVQQTGTWHPELEAKAPHEAQCSTAPLYDRLPCFPSNFTMESKNVLQCLLRQCCMDVLSPPTFLSAVRSFQTNPFNLTTNTDQHHAPMLNPGFPSSPLRSGTQLSSALASYLRSNPFSAAPSLQTGANAIASPQVCPYQWVPQTGLPDLSDGIRGCCEPVWCYQRKRLKAPSPSVQLYSASASENPLLGNSETITLLNSLKMQSYKAPSATTPSPTSPRSGVLSTQAIMVEPGQWEAWGEWGTCSVTCGVGNRTRTRKCTETALLRSAGPAYVCSDGKNTESKTCNYGSCPSTKIQWSAWDVWSFCSAVCGNGQQSRKRTCKFGTETIDNYLCVGAARQSRPCGKSECSRQGNWGPWSAYGRCRAACGGGGSQVYHRVCFRNMNPIEETMCLGQSTKVKLCHRDDCISLTDWGNWEECSRTCGSGFQERRRLCIKNGFQAEASVCNGTQLDTRRCERGFCSKPTAYSWATWGDWTEWGICTATCGTGERRRIRNCYYKGRTSEPLKKVVCENLYKQPSYEGSACNEQPCQNDLITWSVWSHLSECSVTCGSGIQTRRRYCIGSSGTVTTGCVGMDEQALACEVATKCPVSSDLNWTTCSKTCGGGKQHRLRCPWTTTRQNCTLEERSCALSNCP